MEEPKTTLCYPILEKLISGTDSCDTYWELFYEIGEEGTYGEIWSVCCKGKDLQPNCDHVLKYLPYKNNNTYGGIINEINIQEKCSSLGMCPKIIDAWICQEGGAIVMSLFEMTAEQMLLKYKSDHIRNIILVNIISLVDRLHTNGIYHGDLHLNNIMVQSQKPPSPLRGDVLTEKMEYDSHDYKFYFIDFGKSGLFSSMDDQHIEDDFIEVSAHLQDMIDEYPHDKGFEKLYKVMKEYMKRFYNQKYSLPTHEDENCSIHKDFWSLDDTILVNFRNNRCTLKEAIDKCQPGEPIEDVPIDKFDALLYRFQTERGKKFRNSVDRRYGKWRFILFDV